MDRAPGWIKLYRRMTEWEWYQDIPVKVLFLHLLLKANHKDSRYRGLEVPRGSVVTGRKALSIQTGLSIQQVRTAISKLEKTNEISTKSTNKFTIVTICNYDTYQSDEIVSNHQSTNSQPSNNHQVTNNQPHLKNDNNIKNEKNGRESERTHAHTREEIENLLKGTQFPDSLSSIDGFFETYADYWQYMGEVFELTPTPTQLKTDFKKLIELQISGNHPIEVIDQTIHARAKSFFPIRNFEQFRS